MPESISFHILTVYSNRTFCIVVEPWNQINQCGLSGSGTADDSNRFSWHCRKTDICQRSFLRPTISKSHMVKHDSRFPAFLRIFFFSALFHRTVYPENFINTYRTSQCSCYSNNQVRQCNQRQQNLIHIIDQRHNLSLGYAADLYLPAAKPQDTQDRDIDHHIGDRVHQCRNLTGIQLCIFQVAADFIKLFRLFFFPGKCTYHSGTYIIFSRMKHDLIQNTLYFFIDRYSDTHNQINCQSD